MKELLYGREVLKSEVPKEHWRELEEEGIIQKTAVVKKKGMLYCKRCNTRISLRDPSYCSCEGACGYCTNCIQMGKVKSCSFFYSFPEPNHFQEITEPILKWEGTLSEQQKKASDSIIHSVIQKETRLLWAVAGAGKTEMLFRGIEQAIRQKKRICIASPRIDVCLELAPRIQAAFPNVRLAVLYGEMEEPYRYTQLVIATTHQLYRFKEAFDVLVIDEMDAFPFYLDESLHFAAKKARKKESTLIYLTATPSRQMQKQIKKENIEVNILPARYHGHPLPVPLAKWSKDWKKRILSKPNQTVPIKHMKNLLQNQKRFLVFIPNISWMLKLEEKLGNTFLESRFECVYSSDPNRKKKVQLMRDEKLDFLMTTTILERGVTFPNIQVLVIGAEDRVFTESALVQIAGRAGRSPTFPTGEVLFFHNGWSKEMKRGIRQIKRMNELAKRRGLLK